MPRLIVPLVTLLYEETKSSLFILKKKKQEINDVDVKFRTSTAYRPTAGHTAPNNLCEEAPGLHTNSSRMVLPLSIAEVS